MALLSGEKIFELVESGQLKDRALQEGADRCGFD